MSDKDISPELSMTESSLGDKLTVADINAGDSEWIAKIKAQGWDGIPKPIYIDRVRELFSECAIDSFREKIISGEFGKVPLPLDIYAIAHRGTRYLEAKGHKTVTEQNQEPKDIFGDVELNIPSMKELDEEFYRSLDDDTRSKIEKMAETKGRKTTAICPTGHEPFFDKLKRAAKGDEEWDPLVDNSVAPLRGHTPQALASDEPAFTVADTDPEHVEWLRKKAIREEYESLPLLRDRDDMVAFAEQLLGRFLGACRIQREKPAEPWNGDRTPLFNEELDGMLVEIGATQLTRHITICIEKIGFISICMGKDWVYPGTYEEQLENFTNEVLRMHLRIQFEQIAGMDRLARVLAKRDRFGMDAMLPPGVTFRFKGNKGVFIQVGDTEVYYKDYSIHQHNEKMERYTVLRDTIAEHLLVTKFSPADPVDYHKSRPYLGQVRQNRN